MFVGNLLIFKSCIHNNEEALLKVVKEKFFQDFWQMMEEKSRLHDIWANSSKPTENLHNPWVDPPQIGLTPI